MIAESQYYTKTVIPGKTYSGINVDVPTLNLMALWIVDADQPTELIYRFTKALWEHRDELEKVHDKCKDVTFNTALDGLGILLHPGAGK
jgi:TRAP transporter TAXI family solute receptor